MLKNTIDSRKISSKKKKGKMIIIVVDANVEQLLAVAGAPYDTLEEVIGIRGPSDSNINIGSLKDFGVRYREVPVCYHYIILFKYIISFHYGF